MREKPLFLCKNATDFSPKLTQVNGKFAHSPRMRRHAPVLAWGAMLLQAAS
jgi:hypothetical protein